jgi:hypothetical protein
MSKCLVHLMRAVFINEQVFVYFYAVGLLSASLLTRYKPRINFYPLCLGTMVLYVFVCNLRRQLFKGFAVFFE